MEKHALKILPKYFNDLKNGKNFELRKDDRNYKVGDKLVLYVYDEDAGRYTGEYVTKTIAYVLRDCGKYGLKKGYCILALKD